MPYVPASLNFRGAVFAGDLGARSTANLTRQREAKGLKIRDMTF
jgi:hypothetical protein